MPNTNKFNATALTVERHKTHGNFTDNARLSQAIKTLLRTRDAVTVYTDVQREALEMIALKLSRIASGNPHEPDHWRDIAGYATLVVQELEKLAPEPLMKQTTLPYANRVFPWDGLKPVDYE